MHAIHVSVPCILQLPGRSMLTCHVMQHQPMEQLHAPAPAVSMTVCSACAANNPSYTSTFASSSAEAFSSAASQDPTSTGMAFAQAAASMPRLTPQHYSVSSHQPLRPANAEHPSSRRWWGFRTGSCCVSCTGTECWWRKSESFCSGCCSRHIPDWVPHPSAHAGQ